MVNYQMGGDIIIVQHKIYIYIYKRVRIEYIPHIYNVYLKNKIKLFIIVQSMLFYSKGSSLTMLVLEDIGAFPF